MKNEPYYTILKKLCERTGAVEIDENDKYVIFSDLHIGDRNSHDDFLSNSALFLRVLQDYYLPNGYTLILNGDIEELHRYTLHEIREKWSEVYKLFDRFAEKGRLYKIYGNHDSKLFTRPREPVRYPLYEAVKLDYNGRKLFIFHGHQLSYYYQKFNDFMGLILRLFAKPLRIRHYSVAHDKQKKYTIERRMYEFAKENGLVSIIGHTHRPLFESMSKVDTLNYKIETQLRRLQKAEKDDKPKIETHIRSLKKEIDEHMAKKGKELSLSRVYSDHTIVPCVFNSGSVIGKRGMTAIEIKNGEIALIHWFDSKTDKKYIRDDENNTTRLDNTDYFRTVLKKDDLDYIFTRIELLT